MAALEGEDLLNAERVVLEDQLRSETIVERVSGCVLYFFWAFGSRSRRTCGCMWRRQLRVRARKK